MSFVVQKEKAQVLEAAWYVGKVVKVEDFKGKFGPSVRFTFELEGTEVEGFTVSGICSLPMKVGNKLDNWVRALGIEVLEENSFDLEQLYGMKAKIKVDKLETKDNKIYNNVIELSHYTVPAQVVKPVVATAAVAAPKVVASAAPAEAGEIKF